MIKNDKDFIQGLRGLHLPDGARMHMRERLISYTALHTMPLSGAHDFASLSAILGVFRSRRVVAAMLAFLAIAGSTGVTASAAEKALPGDALYVIKVVVNEPMAAVFAGSDEAKARLHAKLAVRRVEESEALSSKQTLTPEVEEILTKQFSYETAQALAATAKLELSGDVSASLAIRTELTEQLVSHVAAPEPVVAGTATSAATAPVAMRSTKMAVSAMVVEEVSQDETSSKKGAEVVPTPRNTSVMQGVLAKTVVALAEYRNRTESTVISPRPRAQLDTEATEEARIVASKNERKGLLSGASVVQSARTATSTPAGGEPATGTTLFTSLLKERNRDSDTSVNKETSKGASLETAGDSETGSVPAKLGL